MNTISKEARAYMAQIGRKGGKSGKGTKWRREACRHAAIARWRACREQKRLLGEQAEAPVPRPEPDERIFNEQAIQELMEQFPSE